jgi:hypothetical protein
MSRAAQPPPCGRRTHKARPAWHVPETMPLPTCAITQPPSPPPEGTTSPTRPAPSPRKQRQFQPAKTIPIPSRAFAISRKILHYAKTENAISFHPQNTKPIPRKVHHSPTPEPCDRLGISGPERCSKRYTKPRTPTGSGIHNQLPDKSGNNARRSNRLRFPVSIRNRL